jgi:hypothetical protein
LLPHGTAHRLDEHATDAASHHLRRGDDLVDAEWPTLRSVITHATGSAMPAFAWQLAWACNVFLRRADREAVHRSALEAAARADDNLDRATSARFLADAVARLGRQDETLGRLRPLAWVAGSRNRTVSSSLPVASKVRPLGSGTAAVSVWSVRVRAVSGGARRADRVRGGYVAVDVAGSWCAGPWRVGVHDLAVFGVDQHVRHGGVDR